MTDTVTVNTSNNGTLCHVITYAATQVKMPYRRLDPALLLLFLLPTVLQAAAPASSPEDALIVPGSSPVISDGTPVHSQEMKLSFNHDSSGWGSLCKQ